VIVPVWRVVPREARRDYLKAGVGSPRWLATCQILAIFSGSIPPVCLNGEKPKTEFQEKLADPLKYVEPVERIK
jgi:hypothetical protein